MIEREPAYDEEQRRELGRLVQDARVLTDLVNDMLLAAELQHRPQEPIPVDLGRVVAEIRDSFASTADASGVDIVIDAGPGERHVVRGVPSPLRRAIAALIDNALAHSEVGGTITVALSRSADTVHVRVKDDGTGLDPTRAAGLT
jgi:signal transduction histidine kinase